MFLKHTKDALLCFHVYSNKMVLENITIIGLFIKFAIFLFEQLFIFSTYFLIVGSMLIGEDNLKRGLVIEELHHPTYSPLVQWKHDGGDSISPSGNILKNYKLYLNITIIDINYI